MNYIQPRGSCRLKIKSNFVGLSKSQKKKKTNNKSS